MVPPSANHSTLLDTTFPPCQLGSNGAAKCPRHCPSHFVWRATPCTALAYARATAPFHKFLIASRTVTDL